MENDEKYLIQLIELYKEGKITRYSLERELSMHLGTDAEVIVHDGKRSSTGTTFGIFPVPDVVSGKIRVFYYIDQSAIINFYEPEMLIEKLKLVSLEKQGFMKEMWKFVNDRRASAVSKSEAIGCVLFIYQSIVDLLRVPDTDFIPSENKIAAYVVKAKDGLFTDTDLEQLRVENIFPEEVLNTVEKMIHDSPDSEDFLVIGDVSSTPTENMWKQSIRPFCDGTYDLGHKDIPHDYYPSTNQ